MTACPLPNTLDELIQHAEKLGLGARSRKEVMRAYMMKNSSLMLGEAPQVPTIDEFEQMLEDNDVWMNSDKRQVVMTEELSGFADNMNAFPEYSVLKNPIKLDTISQAKGKARSTVNLLAEKLSTNLDVPAVFITPQEAQEITKNSQNPWRGQAAFFFGGKVYMLPELVTEKTVFHEFAHPLIRSIRINNPKLFAKLTEDLMKSARGAIIMQSARASYPELAEDDPVILEEALVMALTELILLLRSLRTC